MKCSFCHNGSIYFRVNEGNYYCSEHFTKNIEHRVKKTISDFKLVNSGKIAVALSGGKDSTNVLFLLHKIFKNNPKIEIFSITLDEGIKGYRNGYLSKIRSFCERLGIESHVFSFKDEFNITIDELAKKTKSGYCGSCGVLRRYLLNKKARELKATKLATGHNLDDECQSIVMNILKGDLLRFARLGAMPYISKHTGFVTRIKPLIMVPERESALYAMLNDIPAEWNECPYSKDNKLRGKTRDFLNTLEEESPGIKYSIVKSAYKLTPFVKKSFKNAKIGVCKKCGDPSSGNVCKTCLLLEGLGIPT